MENYVDLTISVYYLISLINNDYSSLTDEEISRLNEWEDDLIEEVGSGTFDYPDDIDNEKYFGRCEICRLLSDVVDVKYYYK